MKYLVGADYRIQEEKARQIWLCIEKRLAREMSDPTSPLYGAEKDSVTGDLTLTVADPEAARVRLREILNEPV